MTYIFEIKQAATYQLSFLIKKQENVLKKCIGTDTYWLKYPGKQIEIPNWFFFTLMAS